MLDLEDTWIETGPITVLAAYSNCQIHINFAIQFTKWNIVHIQGQCSFHNKKKQQKSVETEVYKCENETRRNRKDVTAEIKIAKNKNLQRITLKG